MIYGYTYDGVLFPPPSVAISSISRVAVDHALLVVAKTTRRAPSRCANLRYALRHCQVNVVTATLGVVSVPKASSRCHGVPRHERARAQKSLMAGAKAIPSNGE
jgi:hypothetical protein